ncbi:MAG TPA: hypothetical protein VED01_08865 [Burkholderiales bacterium]|nr:hypothetical protein [Burkholderiales bacterium]
MLLNPFSTIVEQLAADRSAISEVASAVIDNIRRTITAGAVIAHARPTIFYPWDRYLRRQLAAAAKA